MITRNMPSSLRIPAHARLSPACIGFVSVFAVLSLSILRFRSPLVPLALDVPQLVLSFLRPAHVTWPSAVLTSTHVFPDLYMCGCPEGMYWCVAVLLIERVASSVPRIPLRGSIFLLSDGWSKGRG